MLLGGVACVCDGGSTSRGQSYVSEGIGVVLVVEEL